MRKLKEMIEAHLQITGNPRKITVVSEVSDWFENICGNTCVRLRFEVNEAGKDKPLYVKYDEYSMDVYSENQAIEHFGNRMMNELALQGVLWLIPEPGIKFKDAAHLAKFIYDARVIHPEEFIHLASYQHELENYLAIHGHE